jgi:hypothetical protein
MRRIGLWIGALLIFLGLFWAGRESSHGLRAFGEHWWCPIPLVAIVVGAATALLIVRSASQTD